MRGLRGGKGVALPLRRPQVGLDVINQGPYFCRVAPCVKIVVVVILAILSGQRVRHGHIGRPLSPARHSREPAHADRTALRLSGHGRRPRVLEAFGAQHVAAVLTKAPAEAAGPQNWHGQLAAGTGDFGVLAEGRDQGLALVLVLVAAAVPRERLLEGAVIAQQAHLQVRLEETELGDLVDAVDALAVADDAHQNLLRADVLGALIGSEGQGAHTLPQPGQLDDVLGAPQTQRLKEQDQAVLDCARVLGALLEGHLNPLAEHVGPGEGLGADEGEEGAEVGELVLDGRAGETPPRVGVELVARAVEVSTGATDCVCWGC